MEQLARAGADSVFSYVERTAEVVPDGVRWQTLSYDNQPQYDLSIFNGVSGIVFFLADYFRLTGNARARDLALGAQRWCSRPQRLHGGTMEEWRRDGLCRGRAGVGMAALRLAEATGDRTMLAEASTVGQHFAAREPGPVTDFLDGAAGEGIFLLRLAAAEAEAPGTGSNHGQTLHTARRWGEWLERCAIRDAQRPGCYWPWETGGTEHSDWFGLSFIPGSAGIGYFLLLLHQATGEARWANLARAAAETLTQQARPDHGGLNWPDTLDGLDKGEALRCQWCNGAPGVGLFYLKAHEVLSASTTPAPSGASDTGHADDAGGTSAYLTTAEAAGEATFQYGDVRQNAVLCHGLSGQGQLFLELYRVTRKMLWLERAHDFAQRAFTYRTVTREGDVWQADDPGYRSPDYMLGASAAGHFFLRLLAPLQITSPLL